MHPTPTPEKLREMVERMQAEQGIDKTRLSKVLLAKDRKTLLIKDEKGKTYTFEPEREQIMEYCEATYSKDEYAQTLEFECFEIDAWHYKERILLAKYFRYLWTPVRLKEVYLTEKVQRAVNRATKRFLRKSQFLCTNIVMNHTVMGRFVLITGVADEVFIQAEASTLKEAVQALIEKVKALSPKMNNNEALCSSN
jgi:hypothetical protein